MGAIAVFNYATWIARYPEFAPAVSAPTAAAYFTEATSTEAEIRALARELYDRIDWDWARNGKATVAQGWKPESGFLTNVRHQGLIQDSLGALDAAKNAVVGKVPHELLLLDLYNALRPLDAITGATTNDDILNLIFSTFCIGK